MTIPLTVPITLPNKLKFNLPTGLFINNKFVPSISGSTLQSFNPATGDVNATIFAAEKEDVDVAVSAARKAFKSTWKKFNATEKGILLNKLANLLEEERELLASIEAWDSGKPKDTNAVYDIDECIQCFRYYAGWADKVQGRTIPISPEKLAYTIHEPYGVVGQIIPWNYPLAMAAWKLGPALAAGNCVVLKSAEQTPLSLLYLATLFEKVGFPPGVVNVLSGYGKTAGSAIASHSDVDKIAFTGSTATGKIIQQLASSNLKAVTLECGGKSPLVILNDADLDQAVKWAAFGIMSNMGQICTATSRIYIQEEIYETFLSEFAKHVKEEYIQGLPFEDSITVGPQVSKQQQERVLSYIEAGKAEGARVVLGGKAPHIEKFSKGYFVEPTIFADVTPEMRIVKEEIFGPVVSCGKFKTIAEAIELANDTCYGLGAAVFSQDITKAHQVANELEAGMVWINSSNDSDIKVPFGGVKMSGFGRELGEYGLSVYTQAKAIHLNLGNRL